MTHPSKHIPAHSFPSGVLSIFVGSPRWDCHRRSPWQCPNAPLTLQGYGHIGRETARLLKAFNVDVIVANSNGERREDDGVSTATTRRGDEATWRRGDVTGAFGLYVSKAGYQELRTASWRRGLGTGLDLGVMHCADDFSTFSLEPETRTVSGSHSACMMLSHYLPDLIVDSWRPSSSLARNMDSADTAYPAPGSIPSAYYSTNDKASFDEFLSRSDILIASLPSTPQTHYMLDTEHLSECGRGVSQYRLPPGMRIRMWFAGRLPSAMERSKR
jgi:hypothetical protein